MHADELASPVPLTAADHVPNGWITFGEGPDLDSAFDDAVSSAWFDLGRTRTRSSVIDVALSDVDITDFGPLPYDAAVAYAQRALSTITEGSAIAVPVGHRNHFKRRRVNVKIVDPSFGFAGSVGQVKYVTRELHDHLRTLVEASTLEVLGAVELRRPARSGYKVVTERNTGKNVTAYGVFAAGSPSALSEHRTAAEATRWAKAVARKGDIVGGDPVTLEIRPVVTRNGSKALVTVRRERVRLSAPLRVEILEPKDVVKTTGWVIAGAGLTNTDAKGPSES